MTDTPASVDEYIAGFPPEVQERLKALRAALHAAVPGMGEGIRYGIPIVTLNGAYVVHYAAWKKHIGMYPVPVFDGPLEDELTPLRSTKDTIKLQYSKPQPLDVIGRLVVALAAERAVPAP